MADLPPRESMDNYRPAAAGYLYYKVATNPTATRREWADLKTVAGSGTIVAFGSRWEGPPQLRSASAKPENPDPYSLNMGVTKISGRTDYAPIQALIAFKK